VRGWPIGINGYHVVLLKQSCTDTNVKVLSTFVRTNLSKKNCNHYFETSVCGIKLKSKENYYNFYVNLKETLFLNNFFKTIKC